MKRIYFLLCSLLVCAQLGAQTGILKGRISNALNNDPVEFAVVTVQGTNMGATTDEEGNYEITDIPSGFYNVIASCVGFGQQTLPEVQITSSKPSIANFALEELTSEIEEVEVKANPFFKTDESPVSLRSIGVTEIQRNPGGNRDISRVLQSLPGVTSTASFRNDLLIRGGAPNENRFYIDDIETPNINHFATQGASGGPVGMINVDFIREVNFFSGAFPANRGNALSSVFNFNIRDSRDDRIGATFTLGSSDFGATVEGPLSKNKKTTFLASARYSYLQFLFSALKLPFLPTYTDFQFKVKHKINNKSEFYVMGLGAIDQFKLNLNANETENQRFLLAQLPVSPQWSYTIGAAYKRFTENGYWVVVLSRNMLDNRAYKYLNNNEDSLKILDYHSQESENKLRFEHTFRTRGFRFGYGANVEYDRYFNNTYNRIATPNGLTLVQYETTLGMLRYGAYFTMGRKFLDDRLSATFGLRIDGNSYSKEMSFPLRQFSPRFSLSYAVNDQFAINFNTGLYYQLPPYTILGYKYGNGELVNKANGIKYIRNSHFVLGVEYNTSFNSRISVEGYYKRYKDYPFLLVDSISLANLGGNFGVVGNTAATPLSEGRTAGVEIMYQQKLFKGFYGILSYTFGMSEFTDKNNEYVPSAWDSRHIVNVLFGKEFKKNWQLGIKFRMQTGLPYTPYDATRSALIQNWDITGRGLFDYDRLNTLRTAISHQVDFRVDKKWYFKKWSLNLYLDIQNVYGNAVGADELLLDEDANGNAQIDPNNPNAYLLKYVPNDPGNAVPTLGVVVQF